MTSQIVRYQGKTYRILGDLVEVKIILKPTVMHHHRRVTWRGLNTGPTMAAVLMAA